MGLSVRIADPAPPAKASAWTAISRPTPTNTNPFVVPAGLLQRSLREYLNQHGAFNQRFAVI